MRRPPILTFGAYFDPGLKLPAPPSVFGYESLVKTWGALGNTDWGDCVIAGAYHAEQLWCAQTRRPFPVTTARAVKTYSEVTGFTPDAGPPGDNPTDQGTDPDTMAAYWRDPGIPDSTGKRHRIVAYLDLTPGNLTELWLGIWLFGCAGIAVDLPQQWLDGVDDGDMIWDAMPDPQSAGGHYVLGVGRDARGNIPVVSWGILPQITPAGYQQFNVQTLVYLSEDMFRRGVDIEGFRFDQLRDDIAKLRGLVA